MLQGPTLQRYNAYTSTRNFFLILLYNREMTHCPNRDGLLKTYAAVCKNDLPITYARCPNCRGYWLSSFAANFLKDISIESESSTTHYSDTAALTPLCPDCKTPLVHARGDNIPSGVTAYRCPNNHGYFFPAGELAKFKTAQNAKVTYHKLWNIPLPSVSNVLLAAVAVIMIGSITAITISIQKKQTTVSQAKELLVSHYAFSPTNGTIFITATTSTPASVTVSIPSAKPDPILMESQNRTIHTTSVTTLPPGIYEYFFTIFVSGKSTQTDRFSFTIAR